MERIIDANIHKEDDDVTLRPQLLKDYIGQEKIKEQLYVYIKAALKRNESLTMFYYMGHLD